MGPGGSNSSPPPAISQLIRGYFIERRRYSPLRCFLHAKGSIRETREGWPLLNVETEVNGDSKSTNKGVLPWLVRWACRASTRYICSASAALIGPVDTISMLLSPSPSKLGRQPCWVACLLVLSLRAVSSYWWKLASLLKNILRGVHYVAHKWMITNFSKINEGHQTCCS